MTAQCGLSPSKVLASELSGSALLPVAFTCRLFLWMPMRFFRCGEAFTILSASTWQILAWSLLVAAQYTSAPGSLSKSSKANPKPEHRALLPFFLPTAQNRVRNLRVPSALFHPTRLLIMNCCQGSSVKGWPAHWPLLW